MKYIVFHKPIYIALAVGLLVGLLVLTQYGESWDEQQFYKYADRALQAYSTWPRAGTITLTGNTYDNYGPAYVMLVALGARLLGLFIPLANSDLRHLLYFLTYLVGIWAFFDLCRRWLSPGAAFGATLLLATQPLFWGHAFISPKDIPFLTFFLFSLLLGFRMVDGVQPVASGAVTPPVTRRVWLLTWTWLVLVVVVIAAVPVVKAWLEIMVSAAAVGHSNIFSWIASDIGAVKPEVYVQKYFTWFLRAQITFLLFSSIAVSLIWRRRPSALNFLRTIAPAGVALGLTTSIRVLGPFAGLMVAAYAIWKWRRKSIPCLLAYGLIASMTMYLTWPYLWADPVGHFMDSVRVMSEYPWRGVVLFGGVMYATTEIPRTYLPVLLGIQLTEPVWLLFAVGFAFTAYEALRRKAAALGLLALTLVWLVLPLVGLVVTRSPLYDNFRQVIFLLPPVFIMAGVVFSRVKQKLLQAALIGVVILPGMVDGARLHPYEYIYYNRFIGGVAGAFREYELDYWGTSYREAAMYLNAVAPANANVWAEGPAHLLQVYVRPDIKIYSTYEVERAAHYAYVVALTRYNLDLQSYPQAPTVHVIERDGGLLTVIKRP